MDCIIRNHKNLYLMLNEYGKPVTCSEKEKGMFEYSKAQRIIENLPKNLRKLKFKIETVPEKIKREKKIIQSNGYQVSEDVTRWIELFGECSDILEKAKEREKQLANKLNGFDEEIIDLLHIVEMEPSKDLYNGWKLYKLIRENRKRRRSVKDELLIVENVLEKIDISHLKRERVQKAIDGLFNRKYKFRIVEEVKTE